MWRYVARRILWMIFVLLGVAFIIFTVLYFTPGNPAELLLGANATAAEVDNMEHLLGIDRPYLVQLGDFLYSAFIKFDLGTSWTHSTSIISEIFYRLPRTLGMGLASMALTISIGIPVGIFAAKHQGSWQDYGIISLSLILVSLPEFWLALMFVIFFSIKLGILPVYGIGGVQYYILPVMATIFGGSAGIARQTRSAYLEVMRADFVTTVRAKGQSEKVITTKHILPNALMPVITMVGGRFAMIVAGMALLEKVFAIPGVGLYLLNGITYHDYPVIRGCALFFAVFASVTMLAVDLIYAWVDPRIKARFSVKTTRKKGYRS